MKVLLVNRFFGGSQVPTGRMLGDVARELSGKGHDVCVLASGSHYTSAESGRESVSEVKVHCLVVAGSGHRFLSWILFWAQACVRVPFMKWDRCVLLTDPPFMVVAARLAKIFSRTRRSVIWWTMDLYPESLVAGGLLREGGLAQRVLRSLNEFGIRGLDGVICLGERQRDRLQLYRGWKARKGYSAVVPPWDDRRIRTVEPNENLFLKRHGWLGRKVALYAGNLGRGHSFMELLEGAREMLRRAADEWVFAFVVRGAKRVELQAASRDLPNVAVLDYVAPEETSDLLSAASVHTITMSAGWEGVVVPSKLYGVLRTSAPVLFVGPLASDTAEAVRAMSAGETLPTGSSGLQIADALERLASRPWTSSGQAPSGASRIAAFVSGISPTGGG